MKIGIFIPEFRQGASRPNPGLQSCEERAGSFNAICVDLVHDLNANCSAAQVNHG